jgi:hypothetical protein
LPARSPAEFSRVRAYITICWPKIDLSAN